MIGKFVSAMAGRSVARSVGGAAAGPAGAIIGAAVPFILPNVARALGPWGMVAAAVGGLVFTRWMERRKVRQEAMAGYPTSDPAAQLASSPAPLRREAQLRRAL